jgi:FkbM family methyltransferase
MLILDTARGHDILQQLGSDVGDYRWLWSALKLRSRLINGIFPARFLTLLKPLCRKRYFIGHLDDGTKFVGDVRDFYSAYSAFSGTYDAWLVSLLSSLSERNPGTILDVGANQGLLSAALGRRLGSSRNIVAFEPMPETASRAAATLALNDLSNVTVLAIAVGDTDETVQINVLDGHSDLVTVRPMDEGVQNYRAVSVPCRRLDALLDNVLRERVGLIKIDVEGFEPNVIRGAQALIARDRPAIVFEYWPEAAQKMGWRLDALTDVVSAAGGEYQFEVYDGGHDSAQRLSYPPPSDQGIYNIVALPVT